MSIIISDLYAAFFIKCDINNLNLIPIHINQAKLFPKDLNPYPLNP
ncbi:MAG: hypothetical protein JG777_2540 [Clostridia bacterium]|jgi:hypothetical protein|nr:hypothetical protein [Clostridia bacterium]